MYACMRPTQVSAGGILMNYFHATLVFRNLTTNEEMNKHRCAG